jgi:hypothetical protein
MEAIVMDLSHSDGSEDIFSVLVKHHGVKDAVFEEADRSGLMKED